MTRGGIEDVIGEEWSCDSREAAYTQFVKWLMEHQKEAGVFAAVSGLVDQLSDNPAAKITAQEIAERLKTATAKVAANAG
jgi:hypothetical protein